MSDDKNGFWDTEEELLTPLIPQVRLSVLLSCPFCGHKATRCPCVVDDPDTDCTRIACEGCGAEAVWNTSDFGYNVSRWNRRASGWISVEDKFPEPGDMIIAGGLEDGEQVSELGFRSENDIEMFMKQGQWLDFYFDVTHWMPLPDVPK